MVRENVVFPDPEGPFTSKEYVSFFMKSSSSDGISRRLGVTLLPLLTISLLIDLIILTLIDI